MTMTSTLSYFKRLGLHGSRLLWRVLMVLVPLIGYSVIKAVKFFFSHDENEDVNFDRAIPDVADVGHPLWDEYWNKGS